VVQYRNSSKYVRMEGVMAMQYILEGVIFIWFIFITFRIGELQNQIEELRNNGKKRNKVK
jgi:hypothetical protein